jgi:NTE family protein
MESGSKPRVAIACQGGGSHAAFTAGLLGRLLEPQYSARFDLVALSGTSGGAVCAALVWSGIVVSGLTEARRRLLAFWRELAADDPVDAAVNFFFVCAARLPGMGDFSPHPHKSPAEIELERLLRAHLKLEELTPGRRLAGPTLLIGAADILNGRRRVFSGATLDYPHLIASAAVPNLFRAIPVDDTLFWDGLFACNPPIRELTHLEPRPEEIWVVRLNPKARQRAPASMAEIIDRRNELAGNLSLDQELYFIQKINELRSKSATVAQRYQQIAVKEVEMDDPALDYPSKLDRSRHHIEKLMERGADAARLFFERPPSDARRWAQ